MTDFHHHRSPLAAAGYLDRREMLCKAGTGFGALALAHLLGLSQSASAESGAPRHIDSSFLT